MINPDLNTCNVFMQNQIPDCSRLLYCVYYAKSILTQYLCLCLNPYHVHYTLRCLYTCDTCLMNPCLCVQVCAHRPAFLSGVPEGQTAQRSAPVLVRVKGQYTFLSLSATERAWSFLGFNQWRLFFIDFCHDLAGSEHLFSPHVEAERSLNVLKHVEGT